MKIMNLNKIHFKFKNLLTNRISNHNNFFFLQKFNFSTVIIKNNFINNNLIIMEKEDFLLNLNYETLEILSIKSSKILEEKSETNNHKITKEIKLSDNEKKIFEFLLSILKDHALNLTLRVAGGWVRDKLMCRESDDIDIALDSMSGENFAKIVKTEHDKLGLKNENDESKNSVENDEKSKECIEEKIPKKKETKIAVIKTNPEKSKHLETATMKIFGQQIDFVNLRTEKYSEESRIPTIEIGTPKEDALRRDITINSLFYNINKGEIEDFIGSGITDIENKIVRTPIDPFLTFKDDPLRILRCVRFAVRFGFNIMYSIVETASDKTIKECLNTKVSNERIRKELKLTFASNNPFFAIALFYRMNILEDILKFNTLTNKKVEESKDSYINRILNLSLIADLLYKRNFNNTFNKMLDILSKSELNIDNKILEVTSFEELSCFSYSLFNLCLVLPFNNLESKIGKKTVSSSEFISTKALMLANEELDRISKITSLINDFCQLKNEFINTGKFDRLKAALLLRKLGFKNLLLMTLISISHEYSEKFNVEITVKENKLIIENVLKTDELISIANSFIKLLEEIDINKLLRSDEIKPIIDGNEVMNLFNIRGNKISSVLSKCIEIQVLFPKLNKQEITELITKDINNI